MAHCLVAIGANLGDARQNIQAALAMLAGVPGVGTLRVSPLHETAPVGGPPDQPRFVNAAACFETPLAVGALLRQMQLVEQRLGRERRERWAARAIDLDLLLYDELILQEQECQIPHPRLSFRPFVLSPAVEVAADAMHPLLGKTLTQLLNQLESGGQFVELRARA
ncbi:MAG: 2-amino-4-hydroxy-6-hydroxymethyldihydropteridine diphosphokinase, partial [Planctomycetales bacterium]|nr:2-amino-4-hydroxy-6-hydroxymethyldihydropteridine diphosphokinase [Planctomycetales bacterium]